ncbi:MAG: Na+/H+ antiporter NhaC family protein, partial [Myxococcota bacterium]
MPPEVVGVPATAYVGSLWALLPAVTAIVLALVTRQVLVALLGGIVVGALLLHGGPLDAAGHTLDLVVAAAADTDKMKIVAFTLLMGGLVGVITAAGGTAGLVSLLSRVVRTPRSGALATWCLGLVVFFDDYASTLLVGNTMRPLTDEQRISREKLSYIVDSTAAPIASLAVVSTWIGYEVSVLGEALRAAQLPADGFDAYGVFLAGLPARFYPLYALAFVFFLAWFGRDG